MDFFWTYLWPLIIILAESVLMLVVLLVTIAYILLADRKIWAAVQMRRGPNVVGPWGLFQSFADLLKFVLKEPVIPAGANKGVFLLAPLVTCVLALAAWAVIPVNVGWAIADINVGVLYIFAISSLMVYGVIMAGWASNSKYPFLAALRSAAQMVSYEVSIGFVIITVLLCANSLNLTKIVEAQDGPYGVFSWYWLPLFPMFVVFFISALAETNRPPFDLVEAESELVAGFMVEYGSTPYMMFMLGEYVAIATMCAMGTIMFLGGWLSPIPYAPFTWVPGVIWFVLKAFFLFFMFAMVKAIVPRYRYDQLMRLGWKVFLPLSLAMVAIVAGVIQYGHLATAGDEMRMRHEVRRLSQSSVFVGVRARHDAGHALFLRAQGDAELSLREGPDFAALSWRARAAPLSQRRRALHRLQAVRGDLPGAGDYHRGRPAPQRRHPPHHALRHRHGEVHLLRPVPGGLPGRRHRRGPEFRIRHRDARGTLLRQGSPARERRSLGTRDRQEHGARRAL